MLKIQTKAREYVFADDDVAKAHNEAAAAQKIVARADSERDSTGREVQRAMENFDPEVLECEVDVWRKENDASSQAEEKNQADVDRYLSGMMQDLGLLPGIFSEPIATLVLGSVDPEYRVPLRRVPQSAVTVERCFAHIEALRLPMRAEGMASLARATALTLLNNFSKRDAIVSKPLPKFDASVKKWMQLEAGNQASSPEPSSSQATGSQPAPEMVDDQALAPIGRIVAGFVATKRDVSWAINGQRMFMKAGEPLLRIVPTQSEKQRLAERDPGAVAKLVVVWWQGGPRRLSDDDIVAVRRLDYLAHLEKERNLNVS